MALSLKGNNYMNVSKIYIPRTAYRVRYYMATQGNETTHGGRGRIGHIYRLRRGRLGRGRLGHVYPLRWGYGREGEAKA